MVNRSIFSNPLFKILGVLLILFILSAFIKPENQKLSTSWLKSFGMGSSIHFLAGTEGLTGAYQKLEEMNIHWVCEEIPWREVKQAPSQIK